jgi:polyisoprenoid-binding protein YceI/Flp pilus assembly protein TadD
MMNPRHGRKVALTLAMLGCLTPDVGGAQSPGLREYAVDVGHSIIEFSIGFAVGRVKGRFTQWRGTILYDSLDPGNSSVSVVIETKSIDTGWPHRDQHLRTSDFFDVEKFPAIVFQSHHLVRKDSVWMAVGPLTMHGITKSVAIPFRFLGGAPARDSVSKNMILMAVGALRLARADFGVLGGSTYNSWFDKARSATMSDSIDVTLEVQGWLSDATTLRSAVAPAIQRIRANGVESQVRRIDSLRAALKPSDWPNVYRGQELIVRAFLASGDTRTALALSRLLTEWFPAIPSAYAMRGLVLAAAGDSAAAARQYARAKQLFVAPVRDPNDPFPQDDGNWWYLDHLVRSAIEWKLTSQAAQLAQLVADLYPDVARAHATLGRALASSGQMQRATVAFDRAQAVDPWDTRTTEWRRRFVPE